MYCNYLYTIGLQSVIKMDGHKLRYNKKKIFVNFTFFIRKFIYCFQRNTGMHSSYVIFTYKIVIFMFFVVNLTYNC